MQENISYTVSSNGSYHVKVIDILNHPRGKKLIDQIRKLDLVRSTQENI